MNSILIFGLGIVAGIVIAKVLDSRKSGNGTECMNENLIGKQTLEKEENKQRILGLLESGNGPLTNEHVQQILGFSEASVTRYFDELESEGKVRQVGKTGHAVYYSKTEKP